MNLISADSRNSFNAKEFEKIMSACVNVCVRVCMK